MSVTDVIIKFPEQKDLFELTNIIKGCVLLSNSIAKISWNVFEVDKLLNLITELGFKDVMLEYVDEDGNIAMTGNLWLIPKQA